MQIAPNVVVKLPTIAEGIKALKICAVEGISVNMTLCFQPIQALIVAKARENKIVTRLKGGDPFVFGRGGEEAMALSEAGIPYEIVPGVPAFAAAAAGQQLGFGLSHHACRNLKKRTDLGQTLLKTHALSVHPEVVGWIEVRRRLLPLPVGRGEGKRERGS